MNFITDPRTIFTARNDKREALPIARRTVAEMRADQIAILENTLAHLRFMRTQAVELSGESKFYDNHIARTEKRIADLKGQQ